MNHLVRAGIGATIILGMGWGMAWAQPAASARSVPARPVAAAAGVPVRDLAPPTVPYRKLAPGVMHAIDLEVKTEYSVTLHDVTELLAQDSNFDWAKEVPFRHDIWALDFKYKILRIMPADVPGTDGRMERKQIWYLIYNVTNFGKKLHPIEDADKTWALQLVDEPLRFVPRFTLEVHNQLQDEAPGSAKVYPDKYIPVVLPGIQMREDKFRQFRNTVEMPRQTIAVGETVWGVATWQDIDPRNAWFSVYVEGLTNACRFQDDPVKYGEIKAGGKGPFRSMTCKVLKLNFWRPGDEFAVKENQIRCGAPGQPAYEWVWRRAF